MKYLPHILVLLFAATFCSCHSVSSYTESNYTKSNGTLVKEWRRNGKSYIWEYSPLMQSLHITEYSKSKFGKSLGRSVRISPVILTIKEFKALPFYTTNDLLDVLDRPENQEVLSFEGIKKSESIADFGFMPGCPDCGSPLVMSEGCISCKSCGFSRCE